MKFRHLLLLNAAILTGCATALMAQEVQSVWTGVYTEIQAFRGEKVVDTACIGCHGAGLEGGDSGPKLVGEAFLSAWHNKSAAELFDVIQQTMPENAPGTLKPEEVAAVMAYMLKHNGMPSGKAELSGARDALVPITILSVKP